MNWKQKLSKFEQGKDWESAITLMQNTISKNGSSIDAYLSMNYLLMNLLVEEQYDLDKYDYYAGLLKKYFTESYVKFYNAADYLFFIGKIACMSEWYLGIEIEEAQSMMKKAENIEPENILYRWAEYGSLDMRDLSNKEKMILYAKQAVSEPTVKEALNAKGALGKYLLDALEYWSKEDASTQ